MESKAQKQIILTGDRPTGRLHLGHYVGSLRRRVELQNSGKFDAINILIADDQALTDNADNPAKIRDNIVQVALDYLSVGIDPNKSTICRGRPWPRKRGTGRRPPPAPYICSMRSPSSPPALRTGM